MNGSHLKKLGIFAGGVLFGTAGLKVLGSKEAKKLYVNCLAAGLRARDVNQKVKSNIIVCTSTPCEFTSDLMQLSRYGDSLYAHTANV